MPLRTAFLSPFRCEWGDFGVARLQADGQRNDTQETGAGAAEPAARTACKTPASPPVCQTLLLLPPEQQIFHDADRPTGPVRELRALVAGVVNRVRLGPLRGAGSCNRCIAAD